MGPKNPVWYLVNRIKEVLGLDRTMTAPGSDVIDAVNKQSDQIEELANQGTISKVCNDATAPAGGIPADSYYYHNGVLYYTASLIAQGETVPSNTSIVANGLNALNDQFKTIDITSNIIVNPNIPSTLTITNLNAYKSKNIVELFFDLAISADYSPANDLLLSGLPHPKFSGYSVNATSTTINGSDDSTMLYFNTSGELRTFFTKLAKGKTYLIHHMYLA